MTGYTDRAHMSEGRAEIEARFRALGLVQRAGGTKYTYLGMPGSAVVGCFVRLSKRTMRVVARSHGTAGIFDTPVSKERYYGAATPERVESWAKFIKAKS